MFLEELIKKGVCMRRFFSAVLAFLFILTITAGAADYSSSAAALNGLKSEYSGIATYGDASRVTRVFGTPFGGGLSPLNSAEQFTANYSRIFGVDRSDLKQEFVMDRNLSTQQVMFDRETGQYKFTLVYYTQYKNDIPVYMADLRLLVRNEPGSPLVLAASSLRNLGDFSPAKIAPNKPLAVNSAKQFNPELVRFEEPRMFVWAGIDDMKVQPTLAMEMICDNGKPATPEYQKWRLLVDAQTGEVLYSEDMIYNVNVSGNVSGKATQGNGADLCGPEVSVAMPYARVYIQGGNSAFADANGNYTIVNSGSSPVTVYSELKGDWFSVYNQAGSDALLSTSVTPPGPANFVHNNANTSEYNRAEVNGYLQSNVVRDFALTYNPTYPTIYNQHSFTVNVNLNSTCNAFYDGSSINFYRSGGGCANSGFSTVIHHEYGHHLVNVAGSGQGQYGEGMGDVMGILITDDPGLAYGFYNNCSSYMRTGDNTYQYPCSGEIHDCGQLISGCVWDTRNALAVTYPTTYRDIIANLAVNSMLLHSGTEITPQITIDYLTLDDNDGNIGNGTPHYNEICSGFGAHNMDCPALLLLTFNYPNGQPSYVSPDGGTTVRVEVSGVTGTPQPGTGMFHYNGGSGWVHTPMTVVSPNVYDAVFPAFACGTNISYYFSAQTTDAFEVNDPQGAPGTTFGTLSATALITVFEDDFSTDLGWTGYGGAGEWTRGSATGGSGSDYYGGPDPAVDHTPGSNNYVLGNDLTSGTGGDYSANLGSTYWITSPVINCSGLTNLTLTYYRWLGVEQSQYDHAYFQVYNGSSWVTLFENSSTVDEAAWSEQTYSVSTYADNNANFRIRFGLGSTDVAWQYCGWNIDDVKLWTYECGPVATGTLNGTITDGTSPINGVSVYADDGLGHTGSTTTLGDGTYTLDLVVGTYSVTYSHALYQTQVIPGITITDGGTTTQNVVMSLLPTADIQVTPTSLSGSAPEGNTYNTNLTVSNLGNAALTFTVTPTQNNPSPIYPGDDDYLDLDKKPYEGKPNVPDPNVILQGGDNIGTAMPITSLPFHDTGMTSGYTNDYDEVCPYPGSTSPDVVYSYVPTASRTLDITLCNGSNYDTKLYVYENTAGNTVACDDDTCPGYVSELLGVTVTVGNTYYIVVDGYGGASGNYVIDITSPTLPWLNVNPLSGNIPSGGPDAQLSVEMNALDLTQGTYTGNINIASNDPDQPSIDIPVTFDVTFGGTSGILQGTVTDDVTLNPIIGANVYADDGLGNTGSTVTNGSGFYSMALPAGTYTVSFTASGYQNLDIPSVVVTDGGTTTQDAAMTAVQPSVPTLSEWGMFIMLLLLIASGTLAVIRRRKAVPVEAD